VKQIAIDKWPRLQKLQNMFKIILIAKMVNKAIEEILDEKDLNITELNHLIYAAATIITEEINGTAECKLKARRSKPPPWVRPIQGGINDIRKELSMLVEIKRDYKKVKNIKRIRLFKKYNIEKEEDLNRLIEGESLNQMLQQKRNDYPDTGKDKIIITKIRYLRQTVRNFIINLARCTVV
jgi:hypothetical protein